MTVAYKLFTAQVPVELATEVDELARDMDRPRQWVIKKALASFVKSEREKDMLTLEALQDVREGRVMSAASAEALVASWDKDD
jgi:predicted transcriptional regulator